MRPFINCTATLTINGGSLTFPEVIAAMEQAAHFHVDLDELMERVSARLAELLHVDWAIVTGGTSAALTHATAACLIGTDPEKIQRLPNLEGLKDEVIMPRESRNAYDHAIRTLGVKIIEVNNVEELRKAIGPHTAMIEILGNHFGKAQLDLKDVAPIAKEHGIPILIDAAADYLIVPNPYLALGADLVAYSGGKIIRGPQGGGLLVGRKDLVRGRLGQQRPASRLRTRVESDQGGNRRHARRCRSLARRTRYRRRFQGVETLVRAHHRAHHESARRSRGSSPAGARRPLPDAERVVGQAESRPHRRRSRTPDAGWRARES